MYIFTEAHIFADVMDGMSSADTAFKLFDKDRDGYITRAEFAKVASYHHIISYHIISYHIISYLEKSDSHLDIYYRK